MPNKCRITVNHFFYTWFTIEGLLQIAPPTIAEGGGVDEWLDLDLLPLNTWAQTPPSPHLVLVGSIVKYYMCTHILDTRVSFKEPEAKARSPEIRRSKLAPLRISLGASSPLHSSRWDAILCVCRYGHVGGFRH